MQYVFPQFTHQDFQPRSSIRNAVKKALTYQLNFAFKLRLALIFTEGEPCCEDIVFCGCPL